MKLNMKMCALSFQTRAKYMGKCAEMLKVHIQCWAHKSNLIIINTRKRKHHYLQHLQESSANLQLFPSPVVTRWNSWFHAVKYLDEYLTHLVTFFKKEDSDWSAAVEYFKQLEEDEIPLLKCQSKFVLSDLKTCYKLASDQVFGPETSCLLANPACLKATTAAKLPATGKKCFLKLSSLLGADPAKLFLENVGRLYDPRNIIVKGPVVDGSNVEAQVKTLPFLSSLSLHQMLEWKGMPQQDKIGGDVDVLAILHSLKNDFQEYSCCAVKCVWIPVANTGSERAFAQYNNIMTDKCTALKADNIEIMLVMYFGAV
ncbi:hypothetical protein PR048_026823 [Dryococelus australis]|uniref:Uncharacterized protein n=1 Tax=Dryococelus australis TaxID=614101 RepID=A0ABQ9GMF0_9NEOP|nr:hypothetical protein PR048_026823 [Dryococelus australis]